MKNKIYTDLMFSKKMLLRLMLIIRDLEEVMNKNLMNLLS